MVRHTPFCVLRPVSEDTTVLQTPHEAKNWTMRLMLGLFDMVSDHAASAWQADNPEGAPGRYFQELKAKLRRFGLSNNPQIRGTSCTTSQHLHAFMS